MATSATSTAPTLVPTGLNLFSAHAPTAPPPTPPVALPASIPPLLFSPMASATTVPLPVSLFDDPTGLPPPVANVSSFNFSEAPTHNGSSFESATVSNLTSVDDVAIKIPSCLKTVTTSDYDWSEKAYREENVTDQRCCYALLPFQDMARRGGDIRWWVLLLGVIAVGIQLIPIFVHSKWTFGRRQFLQAAPVIFFGSFAAYGLSTVKVIAADADGCTRLAVGIWMMQVGPISLNVAVALTSTSYMLRYREIFGEPPEHHRFADEERYKCIKRNKRPSGRRGRRRRSKYSYEQVDTDFALQVVLLHGVFLAVGIITLHPNLAVSITYFLLSPLILLLCTLVKACLKERVKSGTIQLFATSIDTSAAVVLFLIDPYLAIISTLEVAEGIVVELLLQYFSYAEAASCATPSDSIV